ncbi:DUF1697 domain-containing protein [Flavobacterium sp. CYK-4]|uniref:DUF1697 domain-containing protein n=1 Tax=Flavobacterium lotistagni TaxID=2709660 RepID=UPI00140D602F|nr:DUF1697 domain-containing protein [Flavobacterium lotistagni]NHM06926.1 DUF1697 domain-containing protein [Flavobacterium lotistagni]
MKTYIALLRGINVSGQKIIKMELLRKVLAELDFVNISTYIQSGNIIFETAIGNSAILEKQISEKIEQHFGFVVPVRMTTLDELKTIVDQNPFVAENLADPTQPYVAFLSGEPAAADLAQLGQIDFQGDRFISKNRVLYLWYARSAADTKLSNAVIEKKLQLSATSRNWKTVLKLIALAQK